MTIAEKITRAKADYDAVHDAGKEKAYAEVEPINAELEQILYGKDTGGEGFWGLFWDSYQQNGSRTDYNSAFQNVGWTNITFKPKYDIKAKKANVTFSYARVERIDVVFDVSEVAALEGTFSNASLLHTVKKMVVSENVGFASNAFYRCTALENITIEGTIGKDNFNVQWCTKLTHDSLMSIINALKDYSGTDTWMTVTIGTENITKLSAEELLIAERKQWQII